MEEHPSPPMPDPALQRTVAAVVLAAGRSRRMGTQKLLLPIAGQPMICRVVDQVLASIIQRVFVVIPAQGQGIAQALADRSVCLVTNPDPDSEMIDSLRCGLLALPSVCETVLVVLGDQPGVAADVMDRLVDAFRAQHRGITLPTFGGKRGHPLMIATRYRDEILTRYSDVGLRGLIRAHPDDVLEVEVATSGILEDTDLPEDYVRIVSSTPRM